MGTSIPLSISTVDFSLAENFIFQSTRSPEAETPLGRKNMGGGTSGAGGGWSSWSSGGSSWGSGSSGGVSLVAGAVAEAGEQSIRI